MLPVGLFLLFVCAADAEKDERVNLSNAWRRHGFVSSERIGEGSSDFWSSQSEKMAMRNPEIPEAVPREDGTRMESLAGKSSAERSERNVNAREWSWKEPDEEDSKDRPEIEITGSSLAFVFDSTGSMSPELSQVKVGASNILEAISNQPNVPIHNYILVPFNDPAVGPVTVTTSHDLFKENIENITVSGGGDCPEMSIGAIKKALEQSLPNSYIYVFTDASAKDYRLQNEVLSLIQRKQSQVNFIMTGNCGDLSDPAHRVYEKISVTSSGQIYWLDKLEVKEALKYVKTALQSNVVNLLSQHKPPPPKGVPDEHEVLIDNTLKQFTVSVSGANASIRITNPKGKKVEGPPQLESLLNLSNVKIVNVKEPDPGFWKVLINSDSDYMLRSTGTSEINFDHGFSIVETVNMKETNYRPLQGALCFLLIRIFDVKTVNNITMVDLVDVNGEIIEQLHLEAVTDVEGLYKTRAFVLPSQFFHLGISGYGKDGLPFKRITSTAINPSLPEKPIINVRSRMSASLNSSAILKCFVESAVPVAIRWYRNGEPDGDHRNCSQSCEAVLKIDKVTLQSEGNYTCVAFNEAGTSLGSQFLEVVGEAPVVTVNSTIFTSVGEKVNLPCWVKSYLPYVVTWNQFKVENERSGKLLSISNDKVMSNHTLNLGPVQVKDEGWYVCTAKNKEGQKQGRVFLVVNVPLTVVVEPHTMEYTEGTSALFSCSASGKPQPKLEWWKQQKKITDEDSSVTIEQANGNVNLVIDYLLKEHEGIYICVASNGEELATAKAELIYTAKPKIEANNETLRAKDGGIILLNCNASGKPKPTIKWYKDGNEIIPNSRVAINENGEFIVKHTRTSDSGVFSCMATNKFGSDTNYFDVFIGSAPIFLQIPKDKKIKIHQKSILPCSAIGVPSPKIKWTRLDGGELNPESAVVLPNGELKILMMKYADTGLYKCTAQNDFGSISTEVKLEVYGAEKPFLNEILKVSRLEGISGSDLTIPCGIILGNPAGSVKWFKDNTTVEENDRIVINDKGNLVLRNAETIHKGQYTCFVSNFAGNSSRSIEISISESPRLAKNLSTNIKGQKGGEIVIPCPAKGFPVPSITWKKNGRPLPLSPTTFQDENGSLIIRNLSEENSGTYTCIGENSAGSASQVISLRVQIPPIFTEDARDQYLNIVEGYMVILNCNSKADPKAIVKWYKNEKPLLQGEELIQEQPELLRFVANVDDTGIYKCIVTNEAGSASKEFNVTVLIPPSILDSKSGGSIKAREGTRMVLKCKVHGVPVPTILWQRNGMYLTQNTSDITITDSGLLILENVTTESAGAYVCDAENLAGIMQRMYYVQVHYAPRIKEENNINRTIKFKEGNEYSLPCHVEGNPKPVVIWRKNGFVVRNEKDNLLVLGDNTLVFLHVSKESRGIYRCEASNEEGSTFREYDIEVLTSPSVMSEGYHTSKKVNEGDPVVLTCPVSNSVPQSTILWVKDGKPLNSLLRERSDEAQIKLSENQGKLVIAEAHPSDSGNYSCSATNSVGRADAKFFLDVLMTPHFEEFNHIAHRTILVGGDVALNCSVSGNPQPKVTWRKGNAPITPENNPGVHISMDKQYLVISNGKLYHTGTYICTAINEVSRKEREFYITVLEPPNIMGSQYETIDAIYGSNILLRCPFTGVPKPEVKWWKQGKIKVTVNNSSENFEIRGVGCEDGGIYFCEVINMAGTKMKKFNVTVLEPPNIELNNVVDKLVTHVGGNISLKCRTKGHPKPYVAWLHNGHVINEIQSSRSRRQIKEFLGELQIFEDGAVTLTLSNVTEDNEGIYTVLASNKAGVIQKNFEVSVLSGPKFPENHSETQTITIVLAHSLILRCPAREDPIPVFQWYHNHEKLFQNTNVSLTRDELLFKKNSNSNHSGTYVCIAENPVGNVTLIFHVKVIEPPRINMTNTLFRLKVNETLEMRCEGVQDEGTNYSWFYKSKLVSNSSRLSVTNGQKKLMISDVNLNDSGEYMCIVSNIAGIIKIMYIAEVFEVPNQITSVDLQRNIQLHHPFLLNCPFDGRPEPSIAWYLNGEKIVYNDSDNRIQIVGKNLMVFKAAAEDAGKYKCVAENLAGSKELVFVVDVYVSAEWSHWSAWSACTVTCGIGTQQRTRVCSADYEGLNNIIKTDSSKCTGESWIEEKNCLNECPIDGGWTTWSSWTPYSSTCGKALRKRFRTCDNPRPFKNGKYCEGPGLEEEFKMMVACPINGEWSEWSQWSACSHTCDGGIKERHRKCASPAPQYGGKFCGGLSKEFGTCNKQKCRGEWHPWSEWSSCSASCGSGQRKRLRKCAAGLDCIGENIQIQECSIRNCELNVLPSVANLRIKEMFYDHPQLNQDEKYFLEKNSSRDSYSGKYGYDAEEISEKYEKCPPGFFSLNGECKDLNECDDLEICDDDEICLNTLGSYQCLNAPCSKDFVRNLHTRNCIKACSKEIACKSGTLVSETVNYSTITLISTTPLGNVAELNVNGEETIQVASTKFQVMESGELFHIKEFQGKGWLYALRVLNKNTLYRVRVEANSYDENNIFVYNVNFILFIIVI